MPAHAFTSRRANLDDLPVLRGLWQLERLPGYELEKRLTEFHVVARPDGVVTGAIGCHVTSQQALLHSPAFASATQQAEAWPALWEHVLTLARSQGVVRLWWRGRPDEPWRAAGFESASPSALKKLPTAFGPARDTWQTLALRDEAAVSEAIELELAALHEAQQAETERMRRQALLWKLLAWLIALAFFIAAAWMLAWLLRTAPRR